MVQLDMKIVDETAKVDSTVTSINGQYFSNDKPLKDDIPPYAAGTLEPNNFLLDGCTDIFPNDTSGLPWGYWSSELSDENGNFTDTMKTVVIFGTPHTSAGITLIFGGDCWASDVTIEWQNAGGKPLYTLDFAPDGQQYFCEQYVENYSRLDITFHGTNKPRRYIRLVGIEYGALKTWTEEIKDCKITEQSNLLNLELPINTIEFTLYSENEDYNILAPSGVYKSLREAQEIRAIMKSKDKTYPMGTFYLESWESTNNYSATLKGIDLLGVLDKREFMGDVYNNSNRSYIMGEIMKAAECDKYTLPEEIEYIRCNGWAPIDTCRNALLNLYCLTSWHVDCSRGDKVVIRQRSEGGVISVENILDNQTLTLEPLVTSATVTGHRYIVIAAGDDGEEIPEDTIITIDTKVKGNMYYRFDQPYHGVNIQGAVGDMIAQSANFINFDPVFVRNGNIYIVGRKYQDAQKVYTSPINPERDANPIKVDNATFIDVENVDGIAEALYNYAQLRYVNDCQIIFNGEHVGDWVYLEHPGGRYTREFVELMEIDLVTGLAQLKSRSNGELLEVV